MEEHRLANYEKPPVVEVVCGVLFEQLTGFLAPHLGLLWQDLKSQFPKCMEAPPLPPMIESFTDQPQNVSISFSAMPDFPRVWLLDKEENYLIQIQRDRLLFNWRKTKLTDEYPRLHVVFPLFEKALTEFREFVAREKLGQLKPLQYELTYINNIPHGQGWEDFTELKGLFPDFNWRKTPTRFLRDIENIKAGSSFRMPNETGRLHITIQNGFQRSDKKPTIRLELTARGIGQNKTDDGMREWFRSGHEWIVKGFNDITDSRVQKDIWGRIDG